MYKLLCGHTPFSLEKKDDIEILNQITTFRPVRSTDQQLRAFGIELETLTFAFAALQEQLTWPETASAEVKDIIQKLLCPELTARLGFQDMKANSAHNVCEGIKRHPFFAG